MDPAPVAGKVAQTSPDIARAVLEYLDLVLWYPKSTLQFGLTVALLVIVIAYVLPKIERAYNASQASSEKGWIMAVLGPVLLILAAAATKVYAFPAIESSAVQTAALIGGVVLMFLVVVVPITKFIFNSEYVASLLSLGIAFVCGAVAVLIMHIGFKAAGIGESAAGKIEERKQDIKEEGQKSP